MKTLLQPPTTSNPLQAPPHPIGYQLTVDSDPYPKYFFVHLEALKNYCKNFSITPLDVTVSRCFSDGSSRVMDKNLFAYECLVYLNIGGIVTEQIGWSWDEEQMEQEKIIDSGYSSLYYRFVMTALWLADTFSILKSI